MFFSLLVSACLYGISSAGHSGSQIVNYIQGPVFYGRFDPIISPGQVSNHVHVAFGGGAFQPNMNDPDTAINAKCTTNQLSADKSNYWTPSLFFNAPNGSWFQVPIVGNNQKVYYSFDETDDDIVAFPKGLQLLAGNAMLRGAVAEDNHNFDPHAGPVIPYDIQCVGSSTVFTDQFCTDFQGLRINIYYPNCYDTSAPLTDFMHNSKYATSANQTAGKTSCSYYGPTWKFLPRLNLEVYYDVHQFDSDWTPNQGHIPWAFAQGDNNGGGAHGDFIAGWDEVVLQDLIDNCDSHGTDGNSGMDTCRPDLVVSAAEAAACTIASPVDEPMWGELSHLPGCNPIQTENPASVQTGCPWSWPTTFGKQEMPYSDMTHLDYEYYGCFTDGYNYGRALTSGQKDVYTIEECVQECSAAGFAYAGLEDWQGVQKTSYTSECHCGHSMDVSGGNGVPSAICNHQCPGNNTQVCGGPNALSVYRQCAKTGCINQSGPIATGMESPISNWAISNVQARSSRRRASNK